MCRCAGAGHLPALAVGGMLALLPRHTLPAPAAAPAGTWQARDGALTPTEATARSGGYWLAPGESFRDGTARALFAAQPELDATLLVRARVDAAGNLEGVGVRMRGRWAWPVRMRGGELARLPRGAIIPRDRRRRAVEVTVLALGDALVATIRDADTGAHLAIVSTHEAAGAAAGVGVAVATSGRRAAWALERLSTRPACGAPMPVESGGAARRGAPDGGEEAPIVVLLPAAEVALARRHAVELEPAGPGRVAMRTDTAGLERLFCDGRTLGAVATDLPWKYLDLEYLRARDQPPRRGAAGSGYASPAMVEAMLHEWRRLYPHRVRVEEIGRSVQGRPILAMAVGAAVASPKAGGRPTLLLAGAMHGDELLGTNIVLDAARQLVEHGDEPRVRRWLAQVVVWCVPIVNPDGVQAFFDESVRAGRKNGRDTDGDGVRGLDDGVDLNRNFPFRWDGEGARSSAEPLSRHFRGSAPASEPETRAIMSLAEREHFVAAVSYHLGNVAVLVPYTVSGARSPEPNEARRVAEELGAALPPHPEGRRFAVRQGIYPVLGTDQDWLRHEHGTVAFIVEAGGWPPPLDPARRAAVIAAARPSWQLLLDRLLAGPSLSGRVRGPGGEPVQAAVELLEVATFEGERWTSRRRDGRFDRYLPAPGRYHLRVTAPGYAPLEREVSVGRERAKVELVLERQ